MSLKLANAYQLEADQLIHELDRRTPDDQTLVIYGSVVRAQGPFSDVDLIHFQEDTQNPATIADLPIQQHLFGRTEFVHYLHETARGWLVALDHTVIHPDQEVEVCTQLAETADFLRHEGSAAAIATMLAEQTADTQRPDVVTNFSRYALKRSLGGKRSTTRALTIARLTAGDSVANLTPAETLAALLDRGEITEEVIGSIFATNALLIVLQNGGRITQTEWQQHARVNETWIAEVSARGRAYVDQHLKPASKQVLAQAGSSDIRDQQAALATIKQPEQAMIAHATIWKLLSNQALNPETLHDIWNDLERMSRNSRVLGCIAVQNPAFIQAGISPESSLLNHPDVQFSLHYRP